MFPDLRLIITMFTRVAKYMRRPDPGRLASGQPYRDKQEMTTKNDLE